MEHGIIATKRIPAICGSYRADTQGSFQYLSWKLSNGDDFRSVTGNKQHEWRAKASHYLPAGCNKKLLPSVLEVVKERYPLREIESCDEKHGRRIAQSPFLFHSQAVASRHENTRSRGRQGYKYAHFIPSQSKWL